jgi:hypothetical protein
MTKSAVVALISLTLALPGFAKTHQDTYPVPCSELWNAIQETLKNSGNYSIVVADSTQMTAAYTINGALRHRENSVHLNPQGTSCEMQTESSYSGLAHDDAGDFKRRVDESLAKLKASTATDATKPGDATK